MGKTKNTSLKYKKINIKAKIKIPKKILKKVQQQSEESIIQDDQFSIDQDNNKNIDKDQKLKNSTPMKAIYDLIKSQPKTKLIKKQAKKEQSKQTKSITHKQKKKNLQKYNKQQEQPIEKVDEAFKHTSNKQLQKDLKIKTLNGVLKLLNFISKHKASNQQE